MHVLASTVFFRMSSFASLLVQPAAVRYMSTDPRSPPDRTPLFICETGLLAVSAVSDAYVPTYLMYVSEYESSD